MKLPVEFIILAEKYLFTKEITLSGHKKWHQYYHEGRRYFFNEQNLISQVINLPLITKVQIGLNEVKNIFGRRIDDKELLIFRNLNGYSLFNFTDKLALKIIQSNLETNFLNNYKFAKKFLPHNIPEIIKLGNQGRYSFVIHRFIPGAIKQNWNNWPSVLAKITPIMGNMYFSNPIQLQISNIYFKKLMFKMNKDIKYHQYLTKEYGEIIKLINIASKKYNLHNLPQYIVFSHGDLVPNNIIQKSGQFYILDWDNGGWHNYLYDLFMQDFYFMDRQVWTEFIHNDYLSEKNRNMFNGWIVAYLRLFQKGLNTKFRNEQIQVSLIICLAEIAHKNFLRHQSRENRHEGKVLLDIVIGHCRAILG